MPDRKPSKPFAQRFLIGFGITALSISGVLAWEPLMGASSTADARGGYPCPPPPTYTATAPPPPPPPATFTPTKVPYPTKTATPVPPTATTPPPPPPPPTATPTEQPCTCPVPTATPTNTVVPPPPPPASPTPTNTHVPYPTKTATMVPPTATPTTAPPPPPPPATPTMVPPTVTPTPEGCTPGFWKQEQHFGAWAIPQSTTLESIFDVPNSLNLDNETFLEALQGGGGSGINGAATILFRAATAAYLNSLNDEISYPLTSAQVISQVNTALATNNRDAYLKLAGTLDAYNNLGCPDAKSLVIQV